MNAVVKEEKRNLHLFSFHDFREREKETERNGERGLSHVLTGGGRGLEMRNRFVVIVVVVFIVIFVVMSLLLSLEYCSFSLPPPS